MFIVGWLTKRVCAKGVNETTNARHASVKTRWWFQERYGKGHDRTLAEQGDALGDGGLPERFVRRGEGKAGAQRQIQISGVVGR